MLVLMKCPNCNADLQMDEAREFMFCKYCGTKIANMQQKVQVVNHIQIDAGDLFANLQTRGLANDGFRQSNNTQTLMQRVQSFKRSGSIDQAIAYCNAILDIEPNHSAARRELDSLMKTITDVNVCVRFSGGNIDTVLQTSLDNRQITRYGSGDEKWFMMPIGRHIIKFRLGSKRYSREFEFYDRTSIARFTFSAGRFKNEIYTN